MRSIASYFVSATGGSNVYGHNGSWPTKRQARCMFQARWTGVEKTWVGDQGRRRSALCFSVEAVGARLRFVNNCKTVTRKTLVLAPPPQSLTSREETESGNPVKHCHVLGILSKTRGKKKDAHHSVPKYNVRLDSILMYKLSLYLGTV